MAGWRLAGGQYQDLTPNERGWLWCEEMQLWLGTWEGAYLGVRAVYPRFYDAEGRLVPLGEEAERQRAEVAEAELARLKALLAEKE